MLARDGGLRGIRKIKMKGTRWTEKKDKKMRRKLMSIIMQVRA